MVKNYFAKIGITILTSFLLVAVGWYIHHDLAQAVTQYPPGSLLQPEDVTSSHIRNGTIVDADVSTSAVIGGKKIAPRGTTGTILLTDGTTIATTTSLKYATSSADLYVLGGKIHASTTNFGGVNYTWPGADGSANQTLQTNGAGTLSWTTAGGAKLLLSATVAEAVTANTPVFFASTTVPRADNIQLYGTVGTTIGTDATNVRAAEVVRYPSGAYIATSSMMLAKVGSPSDSLIIELGTATGNTPNDVALASTTILASSLTASVATTTITWNHPVYVTSSTTLVYLVKRSGANDATHHYIWQSAGSAECSFGSFWRYVSGSWTNTGGRCQTGEYTTVPLPAGGVGVASAANINTAERTIGFADGNIAREGTGSIAFGGILGGFSGLSAGQKYYLCDNGIGLCLTAGTISKYLGTAMSATQLKIAATLAE